VRVAHDPLRLAEDVATLDLLAPGRVVLTVNTGYRELEFMAHDQVFADRAATFETTLELLRAAWTGGSIRKDGHDIVVTPRPASQPHPMLLVGGAHADDAVLAARCGLPFRPSADVPALRDAYETACADAGSPPMYLAPPARVSLVQVAHDPDRWWQQVGEHMLREARIYDSWIRPGEFSAAQHRDQGSILFHPFAGGTPLDLALESAELFTGTVLPDLA
jgi:alkanesulfonate monooxygenase SsuD/methylene tetrahydromethanopterin reductase-like flavin-dependent oxidoreductase (luciferase family)